MYVAYTNYYVPALYHSSICTHPFTLARTTPPASNSRPGTIPGSLLHLHLHLRLHLHLPNLELACPLRCHSATHSSPSPRRHPPLSFSFNVPVRLFPFSSNPLFSPAPIPTTASSDTRKADAFDPRPCTTESKHSHDTAPTRSRHIPRELSFLLRSLLFFPSLSVARFDFTDVISPS